MEDVKHKAVHAPKKRFLDFGLGILSTILNGGGLYGDEESGSAGRDQQTSISSADCGLVRGITSFIVGGVEAIPNEFPWIVALLFEGSMSCGATIMNEWWLITAAHCFIQRKTKLSSFTIIAGSHNSKTGDRYSISRLIAYDRFNADTMTGDIALIRVNRRIQFGPKVATICLPEKQYEESSGELVVAGWGKVAFGDQYGASSTLQKVKLPIISDQQCANMYATKDITVYRSYLCTYTPGRDACEGDSGGPAFQYIDGRAVLVGVVSFGYECADAFPGVFTQVSYYTDWISSNVY